MRHSETDLIAEPESPEQWQDYADMAEWALCVDAAQKYGLITGGPKVDVDRCVQIKQKAARMGIRPRPGCVERLTVIFNRRT